MAPILRSGDAPPRLREPRARPEARALVEGPRSDPIPAGLSERLRRVRRTLWRPAGRVGTWCGRRGVPVQDAASRHPVRGGRAFAEAAPGWRPGRLRRPRREAVSPRCGGGSGGWRLRRRRSSFWRTRFFADLVWAIASPNPVCRGSPVSGLRRTRTWKNRRGSGGNPRLYHRAPSRAAGRGGPRPREGGDR